TRSGARGPRAPLRVAAKRRLMGVSDHAAYPLFSYNTNMNLDTALAALAEDPAAPLDLAEVALELAREEYPSLDVEATLAELAGLARELRPRLRGGLAA